VEEGDKQQAETLLRELGQTLEARCAFHIISTTTKLSKNKPERIVILHRHAQNRPLNPAKELLGNKRTTSDSPKPNKNKRKEGWTT
jgi:hypothetical protein